MINTADTLGLIAGALTTIAFIPQVWRVYLTRSAQDISWTGFSIFGVGVLIWLVYGYMLNAMPIIVANFITLILVVMILTLKWFYRSKGTRS